MRKLSLTFSAFVLFGAIFFSVRQAPAQSTPAGRFDGHWMTKLTCPPKGSAEGYTWEIPSTVQNGSFKGEHGTAGEGGYLLIEGKIAEDGKAKLAANGIVASRKYARGVLAHKGEEYSYNIKAEFTETEGTGKRNEGLGIVGRPCTFDFAKQKDTKPGDTH